MAPPTSSAMSSNKRKHSSTNSAAGTEKPAAQKKGLASRRADLVSKDRRMPDLSKVESRVRAEIKEPAPMASRRVPQQVAKKGRWTDIMERIKEGKEKEEAFKKPSEASRTRRKNVAGTK